VKKFGIHDGSMALLGWLLASLMTAFCAHALIDRAGAWFGGDPDLHADAYAAHAHVAIVPIVLLASMLLTGMLLSIAARAVARRERKSDGVEALAQELRRIRPAPAMGLVASGGLTILIAMEFTEQALAFGHVGSVTEALGGNVLLGLPIVSIVAGSLTAIGLRVAAGFATGTAASAISIVAWIVARLDAASREVLSAAGRIRRPRGRAGAVPGLYASSCRGLRAPPPLID